MTTAMVIANSAIAYCVEFSLQLNFLVISICAGLFFRLFGSALPMATVECSAGTVSGSYQKFITMTVVNIELCILCKIRYSLSQSLLFRTSRIWFSIANRNDHTSAGTVSSADLYVGPDHNFSIGPDICSSWLIHFMNTHRNSACSWMLVFSFCALLCRQEDTVPTSQSCTLTVE
jgi:hypothetical protein